MDVWRGPRTSKEDAGVLDLASEWLDHIVDDRPAKTDELDAVTQSYAIGARTAITTQKV
jgi:hypothetical protein